jgi:hypothetical protein
VLPQLAKSQPFIERLRRIEHLHVNTDPLAAKPAFGQDVLQDCPPIPAWQRDIDDPDINAAPRALAEVAKRAGLAATGSTREWSASLQARIESKRL